MKKLETLKNTINFIQEQYDTITDLWKQQNLLEINFKQYLIKNVNFDNNDQIICAINNYIAFLNTNLFDFNLNLSRISNDTASFRIKMLNSVGQKIERYETQEHQYGEIPIGKCFNDLLGTRIILKEEHSHSDIVKFLSEQFDIKYKCIDSSKQEYKATHIYFKDFEKPNKCFQWELQIWNVYNSETNIRSHKKYKQYYAKWENQYGKENLQ